VAKVTRDQVFFFLCLAACLTCPTADVHATMFFLLFFGESDTRPDCVSKSLLDYVAKRASQRVYSRV
jgi:hypothetical protein